MALVKDTNSYVTVAEAELYFQHRLDSLSWSQANNEEKESALVTATSLLDNLRWHGYASTDSQMLAFPRVGQYFDPRAGTQVMLNNSEVPLRIIRGTYEMAYHLLNNSGLMDNTGSVTELMVGAIELKGIKRSSRMPSFVNQFISPLLDVSSSRTLWRSN